MGQPWGPAGAVGSLGHLAIDGTSLHCAEGEEEADDVLSKDLGLHPLMAPWASPVAEMSPGEPKVPSLTL